MPQPASRTRSCRWDASVQLRFSSLGARLAYERFNIVQDERLDTISPGLTFTFL